MSTSRPTKRRLLSFVEVRPVVGSPARGMLVAGGAAARCALGPAGIRRTKREGDGVTPQARLPVRRLFRRADRRAPAMSGLAVRVIRRRWGWCDAPGHRSYNKLIEKPFSASHEDMWRTDGLYDLVVELGWNDRPAIPGRGSAIFLHAARPGFPPTAGCVAVAPADLRRLVARIGPDTSLRIAQAPRKLPSAKRGRSRGAPYHLT